MDHREVRPSQISPLIGHYSKGVAKASFLHPEKITLINVSYIKEKKTK